MTIVSYKNVEAKIARYKKYQETNSIQVDTESIIRTNRLREQIKELEKRKKNKLKKTKSRRKKL